MNAFARRLRDFLRRIGPDADPPWGEGNSAPARHTLPFLLSLGVVLNLFSITAPGFFGPDEMARYVLFSADRDLVEVINREDWLDFSQVHYRPLTFTLWDTLSALLYETPVLFQLSNALLSVLNGALFYHLVLRVSGQPRAALWGFLAFNLFPAVIFVAGWVATFADKLFLMCALGALHILLSDRNAALQRPGGWKLDRAEVVRQAGIGLLCVLGLTSKETMIPFPAFIAGLCLLVRPWRGWYWSLLVNSAIVGIYLSLRLETMLVENPYAAPPTTDHVLEFALVYWLYPYVWNNLLLHDVLHSPPVQLWLAGILSSLPILLLLLRRRWSFALAFVCYYYVFVAPVLIHCCSFLNLLYGAAPPVAAIFAYVFRQGEKGWVRAAACCLIAILALHSGYVQWNFYEKGVMQQRAYCSLAAIVREYDRREGSTETKFAIGADSEPTWQVLYRSFWPHHYTPTQNIAGLNLRGRVTVHHLRNPADNSPEDAVRLRIRPDGTVVAE